MAKRTSKMIPPHPSEGRSGTMQRETATEDELTPSVHPLTQIIEGERARLMRVHSVLSCLTLAMDHMDYDESDPRGPDCPLVIEIVRDLVQESIDRLDSVHVDPLIDT